MISKESEAPVVSLRSALCTLACATLVCVAVSPCLLAQNAQAQAGAAAPQISRAPGTTTMDPDGTLHISRVLPVPKTISPEAQAMLATGRWGWGKDSLDKALKLYPVKMEDGTVGGVKTKLLTPADGIPANKKNRVLIALHGGLDYSGPTPNVNASTSPCIEGIPIANLTQTLVVCVDFRSTFPGAVDDVLAVYKELLKTHKPGNIGIFGVSGGAGLTIMAAVWIRHDGLPQPGALGLFSGDGDATHTTDSLALWGPAKLVDTPPRSGTFMAGHDPKDPLFSPLFADLKGFPPTLCMTGTRDGGMVGTVNFNRALLRAGADTELVVFDSMPHVFWTTVGIPESTEALGIQAKWFDQKLGK